ncbi:hypothetical protein [Brachybacterium sp. UNK5269]|uniref:hypothetical protein n=1 Tax=Brachybacterium sp. UNK5269 TaxID=3408576 RepID=UPI003BAEF7F4
MPTPSAVPDDFRPLPLPRIALWLIVVALAIVLIALASLTAHQRTTGVLSQNLHTVFWYFDVGREYNLATWYGSGLWLLLGVVAAVIAVSRPALRASWWLLAVVALVASIDEYLEIHERLDVPGNWIAERLPFDVGFTWVLIGAPIALVVVLLLARVVLSLPARARNGIVLGGALFVAGAIGVEFVNGRVLESAGWVVNNTYLYGTMVEELLEMSGIAIALASLLSLFQRSAGSGMLRLDPALRTRTR